MSSKARRIIDRQFVENLECRRLLSSATALMMQPTLDVEPMVTSTAVYGYTPAEIKSAYGFNSISLGSGITANGAGQTIAIVDAYNDPDISSDLAKFDSTFGLSAANLKIVNETGGSSLPATNTSWDLEISLDVEWAHAMAPGANILLVEANSASLGDLLTAVNTARDAAGVSVVSMSWGSTEFPSETSYDSYFTTPSGHQGVTFVASSGDDGGYYGAMWPSISDNVLSVGGTTLNITSSGTYNSETGWSDSTGGISRYEPEAAYQEDAQRTGRETSPDVSYDANPSAGFAVYDSESYDGQSGWFEVGGTSAGSPQWAALVAIADQGRAAKGLGTLNGASGTLPALFSLYQSSTTYSADFHDITSGNNGVWLATPGYDAVTGLGSPKAAGIVAALVGASNTSSSPAAVAERTLSLSVPGFGRGGLAATVTEAPDMVAVEPASAAAAGSRSPAAPATLSEILAMNSPAAAQPASTPTSIQINSSGAQPIFADGAPISLTTPAQAVVQAPASYVGSPIGVTVTPAAASASHLSLISPAMNPPVALAAMGTPPMTADDPTLAKRLEALIGTAVLVGAYRASSSRKATALAVAGA